MKTRILYPDKIWTNKVFHSLNSLEQVACLYFLTNRFIELAPVFHCPDLAVCFDLSISEAKLDQIKQKLESVGLFAFKDEWVQVNNDFSYCDYYGRDRVMQAKEKEENKIPVEVSEYFKGLKSGYKEVNNLSLNTKPINNKLENINNKKEKTYTSENLTLDQVAERINLAFNEFLGRKFKGIDSFKSNLEYWLGTYEPKEIAMAIQNAKYDGFFKDKLTPTMLFRKKNPRGECVDYISQLINLKKYERQS